MIDRVYYLGPRGSYSELAKNAFANHFKFQEIESIPLDSIYKLTRKLLETNSENVAAILPIENSIEGVVRDTQDNLLALSENGFHIFAEAKLTIEHSLISYGEKSQIKTISSHPQALAQCREYIYRHWKDSINLEPVLSTSNATRSLSKNDTSKAAIASSYCAKLYNIPVIETKINDEANNTTRFVFLSKNKPEKSVYNKLSLVFSTENKSGALNRVLNIFEKYELNLSYIDSRPSRKELGEYVFYVDFAGYIEDGNVSQALIEIQPFVKMFAVLSEGAICI